VEVGDKVFAYLQLDGSWCLNNSGIILGSATNVVIDTAATIARATLLRETVATMGAGRPVTLVNTHHHGDHCFGNCVFEPGTTIIAHDLARTELDASGLGLQQLWPDVGWGEVELRLPNLTFPDRMTLHPGDRDIELIHVGPAHTTNDVIAWLPDQQVVFAGDVIFNGVTPFVLMGSVAGALAAVERIRELNAVIIVPGHGKTGGPELLDETRDYLKWIQKLAKEGKAAGLSPVDTARQTDLGQYAELLDAERIVGNLTRAYAELTKGELGRPVDVLAAFSEMIKYHGGTPRCLA
jgi:cyclase